MYYKKKRHIHIDKVCFYFYERSKWSGNSNDDQRNARRWTLSKMEQPALASGKHHVTGDSEKKSIKSTDPSHQESNWSSLYPNRPQLWKYSIYIFPVVVFFLFTHVDALGGILFNFFWICSAWFIFSTACPSSRAVWTVPVSRCRNDRHFRHVVGFLQAHGLRHENSVQACSIPRIFRSPRKNRKLQFLEDFFRLIPAAFSSQHFGSITRQFAFLRSSSVAIPFTFFPLLQAQRARASVSTCIATSC